MQGAQEVGKSATIDNGLGMHTMSDSTQRKGIAAVQGSQTKGKKWGENDLLIVGPGVLGCLVAEKWREQGDPFWRQRRTQKIKVATGFFELPYF
ncbi:uncharacterized protein [Gossypium hirsutum]|uniref:Uncharacterized protein n=1 Tax=Gossypium hirsutum TaxID=3635 RepID=A0ABM3AGX3_GOSHI|nr:uncharacterized protein LOC107917725 [Gossypium hirsutum]